MNKINFFLAALWLCMISQPLFSQANKPQVSVTGGQGENVFYHTVEQGQTVYSISLMYDVGEEDIYLLNPTSRHSIKVGQKLKIPQKELSVVTDGQQDEMYLYHTIQTGETLYGVSKLYKVPAEEISEANPGLTFQTFAAGKTIRIPAAKIQSAPVTVTKTVVKKIEYTIKKKETMYGICKKFNTTSDKLIQYNPELQAGLKVGMLIIIPVETEETVTIAPEQKEFDINALMAFRKEIQKTSVAKIALLLPFQISDTQTSARFAEYYEGFLMAVDSMRNAGLSVELSVYDIGDNDQKIKTVLGNEALLNANLLIGGVTNEQIGLIAEFALKNGIKYVVPSSSKCDKLTSGNACIFQVNTSYQYLFSYATARACALFANYNIILLNTHDKDEKTLFINTFKADMKERKIPFRELSFNEKSFPADLTGALIPNKPNLIVPLSGSIEALHKIKATLRTLADTKPEYQLTLFGYPEWQTYTNECLEDFFALNTYIYTSFYANNLSPDVQRFNAKYKYWYKKNIALSYPKYAMLGFDTGMFFISAISQYGANFESNINQLKYNSIQTGFRFERVNNWGGFINTNMYIVRFNRNFTITRTE
ncbi:MAG: LysM peptidoglycan-binding domain-containing protein [Tannerella sp.]|jgi:LysM repeat protein|nr:LysM peptidoglycan-binding domain-containing protein [Tannerella sp.]